MIEYCKSDHGDRALYAFRHPNIARYSMLLGFDAGAVNSVFVKLDSNYGGAVQVVQRDYQRTHRTSNYIPMLSVEATAEGVLGISLVRGILFGEVIGSDGARTKLLEEFERMISAESLIVKVHHDDSSLQGYRSLSKLIDKLRGDDKSDVEDDAGMDEYLKSVIDARTNTANDWGTW